jgi:hypothetical protein
MSTDSSNRAITEMQAIAVQGLAEGRMADDPNPEVRAAADVAASSANALLAIADTAKAKMDEIAVREQRGELPKAGAETLRREVREETEALTNEADRTFHAAHEDAKDMLIDSFLPEVDQERELLARQEFMLALGDGSGPDVVPRVLGLAEHGSAEAVAVLVNSTYGRQALISKGVRNVDEVLETARTSVASANPELEPALAKLDNLDKAFQAGGRVVAFSLGI